MLDIQEIKTIPILSVAERLAIDINKNRALCFMHNDHHPSLSFQPSKNRWKCFVCDVGGGVIELVEKSMNIDRKCAIQWLANEFGFAIYRNIVRSSILKPKQIKCVEPEPEYVADSEIYEDFIGKCGLSTLGVRYLIARGFSDSNIASLNIQDIDKNIHKMGDYLISKYLKKRLLESGIMKMRNGKLALIWWDHTVLFPFYNSDHKIGYIQGRRVIPGEYPKYINLIGIPKTIYNQSVLALLPDGAPLLVCEGVPDTIAAIHLKYNAIGILGAGSFREQWIYDLSRFKIFVVVHGDNAGQKFADTICAAFLRQGQQIRRYVLPKNKDLNDLLRDKNRETN